MTAARPPLKIPAAGAGVEEKQQKMLVAKNSLPAVEMTEALGHISGFMTRFDGKQPADKEQKKEQKTVALKAEKPPIPFDKIAIQEALISEASKKYLVWIDKGGNLGFSNVQYPHKSKLGYVYVEGQWEKYRD